MYWTPIYAKANTNNVIKTSDILRTSFYAEIVVNGHHNSLS